MARAADPSRDGGKSSFRPGPLLARMVVPSLYGAALLAGFFSPGRELPYLVTGVSLVVFVAHFAWRVHALVADGQTQDVDRVEVGLLAALALAAALEMLSAPPLLRPAAHAVLLVALAGTVPLPGILALPLAAVLSGSGGGPWSQVLLQGLPGLGLLELLALAAGTVVHIEKGHAKRLQLTLDKYFVDREHIAGMDADPSEKKSELSRIDETLYTHLQKIKETAEAHAAVLVVRRSNDDLFIRELVSDSHSIREEGLLSLDGTAFQWVFKNRRPLRTGHLSDPARLGYYRGKVAVRSFLGVPLLEGEQVEGVLAVDSLREDAFTDSHLRTLEVVSHHVMTVLKQEKALGQTEREMRIFKAVHDFSKRIGSCTAVAELLDLVLAVVDEQLRPEFSAAALIGPEGELSVEAVGAEKWGELRGRTFPSHEGLAGWVLTYRQYLHYEDAQGRTRRPVFTKDAKLPEFPSLLIHPLEFRGEPLGVLCLGSDFPHAFDNSAVRLCDILTQQAAQAILQFRHIQQLNQLATTDSLTGLANRRVLFERLSEEVRRNRRYPNSVSFVQIDVDHFKKINDRLGHPAGDEVLRKVAAALRGFARETDLVARQGGEEFALLLPNTDEAGAQALAERIRQGIEALQVEWEGKTIAVKASAGVTALESETDTAEALVSRADQALYEAKGMGRNRVITYSEIREYASWT